MLTTHSVLEKTLGQNRRAIRKGATLKAEGDMSQQRFCVIEGWLAASKSLQDGERQILEFILPGETYDPTGADGRTSFVQIEALCDAVVVAIDTTTWARLLQKHPDLWHSVRLLANASEARRSERMLRMGKSSAETRIAYVLIEMCLRLTEGEAGGKCAFHVPLGQQQLGDFSGLSSVHVCRTLRRLSRQGVITAGDHMDICVHDLSALVDLAGVDLEMLRNEIVPTTA
jgi:CRP-like cAMP-binding protein